MRIPSMPSAVALMLLGGLILSNPVLAEKPDHAGKGKDKQGQKHEKHVQQKGGDHDHDHRQDAGGVDVRLNMYFGDRQRTVIRDYYTSEFRRGHCPPGLAKKRNGCMPPGQAKKWQIGHRLPGDVIYHDLPPSVVIELGRPPAGYKYVRVAKDILLIAVGTSMVMDAIKDLGNL